MNEVKLSREELYALVWAEPMLTLSKKYSISDTGLRKICKRMNIPLPKAGHWQKVRIGKQVPIQALPKDYNGEADVILYLRKEGDENNIGIQSPITVLTQEIENTPNLPLNVSEILNAPDKLVLSVQKDLKSKNPNHGRHSGMLSNSRGELDMTVSPDAVARALCLMDAIIKLLKVRGHNIIVSVDEAVTYAIVQGRKINISLREKMKKDPESKPNEFTKYLGAGTLYFNMGKFNAAVVKDGKQPIEEQLSKILAHLELIAQKEKEQEEQWRIQREKRKEEERIKRVNIERQEDELDDFKRLLEGAYRWKEVMILRDYLTEVEAKAREQNVLNEDFIKWLEWAHKKTDWYDPHVEADDALLADVDKITLDFKKGSAVANSKSSHSYSYYSSSQSGEEYENKNWFRKPWYAKK